MIQNLYGNLKSMLQKEPEKLIIFILLFKPVLTYKHHVIERGKWFPWSAAKFKRMNIGVDLGSREVMGIFETTVWCLKKFLTPIWLIMPAFMTNPLKKIIFRIK